MFPKEFDCEGALRKSSGYACRAAPAVFEEPLNPQVVRRGYIGGCAVRQR